jgi:hypothetical protein
MKKIILISGKAENGKTTTANYMRLSLESKGYNVIVTRYAKYLKEVATDYCGWNGIKDEYGRNLLQQLGTDIIRKKLNKPLFHVGRTCEDIEITQDYYDYVIIDDARYENEIYYPKTMFGNKVVSIRVNRINEDGSMWQSNLTDEQKNHISETSLDDFRFDYYITTRSIDETKNQSENIIRGIIK